MSARGWCVLLGEWEGYDQGCCVDGGLAAPAAPASAGRVPSGQRQTREGSTQSEKWSAEPSHPKTQEQINEHYCLKPPFGGGLFCSHRQMEQKPAQPIPWTHVDQKVKLK